MRARILRYHSDFYYAQAEDTGILWACHLKATLKKAQHTVLVGDWVQVLASQVPLPPLAGKPPPTQPPQYQGWVTAVEPRTTVLPKPKVANVTDVLVVLSLSQPTLDARFLLRLLCHVHLCGFAQPVLVFTKQDLVEKDPLLWPQHQELMGHLRHLGYTVHSVSQHQPETLLPLQQVLQQPHRTWVLAGPSGVGKSSLLNRLNPELRLRVGEVSSKLQRGTHTTRHVELLALRWEACLATSWVADSPGFSQLVWPSTLSPSQLETLVPDFEPFRGRCGFAQCLHHQEPDCAVKEALAALPPQAFLAQRHALYLELLAEVQTHFKQQQALPTKQEIGGEKQLDSAKTAQGDHSTLAIVKLKPKLREANRRVSRQQLKHQLMVPPVLEGEDDDDEEEDLS
jgi:ribosome biogenesis GTPase